eukprot:jgi/Botrbrau1/15828/Bobra.40_1s0014.1
MQNISNLVLIFLVSVSLVPSSKGAVARKLLDNGVPPTAESPLPLMNQTESSGNAETAVLRPESGDKVQDVEAGSGGQWAGVQAIGPNGNHAYPTYCPGYYWRAIWGQTLWSIAQELGGYGGGCISVNSYLNQLLWLNPQFNWMPSLPLIPGDPICFPQGRVWGRRRLQNYGAVGPSGNHGYPSGCPPSQIGYAEAGDTPWSVAQAFHCQYYNNGGGNVNYYLGKLIQYNPQIPSASTPLINGDQICVVN